MVWLLTKDIPLYQLISALRISVFNMRGWCSQHSCIPCQTLERPLTATNCDIPKALKMETSPRKKEYDRDFPVSDLLPDVEERFKIAHIDDKHDWVTEDRRKRIHDWAKTKNFLTRGDVRESKLYQPIIDKYEIRVLEIKPGKTSDQLKGALYHCSVEFNVENPQRHALSMSDLTIPVSYTAISYTWGEPKFDAKFECDGYVKMITRSLESALRHFRQEDRAVVIWVDQICIDQGNNEEKAQQVPLMSRVYEHAINTVIWLGDSADDSDTALQLLKEINVRLQFLSEQTIHPTEFERLCLPKPDSDDWKAIWKLLSRPWFERLWVIQEVALSQRPWVACGNKTIKWDLLANACSQLVDTGISQWLTHRFPTGVDTSACRDLCNGPRILIWIQHKCHEGTRRVLLGLMIESRGAQCTESRDRVYGMLGICDLRRVSRVRVDYSDNYPVTQLYQDIMDDHFAMWHKSLDLGWALSPADHSSVELPSWVPDWRTPQRTTALGSSIFSYQTDGRFTARSLKDAIVLKVDSRNPAWKELQVAGLLFDTLETLSGVFEDPDLNSTAENETLKTMLEFVTNLKDYPSPNTEFSAFWQTLVAGMDERRWHKCPDSFAEIFSYILDLTTGENGSISGQTYTRRQSLPKGRGGLDEEKLRSRKPGSAGDTFQQVRTAMINATKNRRLGGTTNGYIGLFPEHSQAGDGIFVLAGCHLPFVLRSRDNKKFKLVGECYVHGIMGGEAIGPNPDLHDIVLA